MMCPSPPAVEAQAIPEALFSDTGSQPRASQLHRLVPLGGSALAGSTGCGCWASGRSLVSRGPDPEMS